MGEPIWSQQFAQGIAQRLGWSPPDAVPPGAQAGGRCEVGELVGQIAEDFRHLPFAQIGWAEQFAEFLRARESAQETAPPSARWLLEKLQEVREYVAFLRARHGSAGPADESDAWSEEDERDLNRATWQRLDETPWPEDGYSQEGQGNATLRHSC